MPSVGVTRMVMNLAAAVGRMDADERESTLRLLVGSVADAVAEHHTTPEVIGCMDDLRRFAKRTAERAGRREMLEMDRYLAEKEGN